MTKAQVWALTLLRVGLGWIFFYSGITKVLDPAWSAEGYISNASTFSEFFAFLARPEILPIVNLLNEWGLLLIGVSLILGVLVRISAPLGMLVMLLYYLPALDFPYVDEHSYLINDHVIYALGLFILVVFNAGKHVSFGTQIKKLLR